jgi:hypothetical protein
MLSTHATINTQQRASSGVRFLLRDLGRVGRDGDLRWQRDIEVSAS